MKKVIMSVLTVWILVNAGLLGLLLYGSEKEIKVFAATIIIDDDGTPGVDCNYTTIQEGIDAANPGDTVFVKAGIYYENVVVNKVINLTGEDRDITTINGGASNDVIKITSDWVNISGFRISNGGNNGGDSGVDIDTDYNSIYNNNISNNNFYGILCDNAAHGNTIKDNIIYSNDNHGIYMVQSYLNNLTGNQMIDDGIYLKGGNLFDWNSHYIDTSNTVNGKPVYYWKNQTGGTIPPDAGQVILANCSNITIQNLVLDYGTAGIDIGYSSNIDIIDNAAKYNDCGIYISYSTGNNIINNTVSNSEKGIYLFYSSENNLINNTASSNLHGILLDFSNLNIIKENKVQNNGYAGINIQRSKDNFVTENQVSNNEYGIALSQSSTKYNIIANNNVFPDNYHGIDIFYSTENVFVGNNVSHNIYGIYIKYSADNNTLSDNIISSNSNYAIYIKDSSYNNIYHNILMNTKQAYDNLDDNYWDNGYPSGGNYWSNYAGIDNFKGPGQDIVGSDGIGDSDYVIDSNSSDNYPLMEPFPGEGIPLKVGWNLISIPSIQLNTSLSSVLFTIEGEYDAVQWYNSTDTSDHWKHYHISKPSHINDLTDINHKMGFWIHIINSSGTVLRNSGTQPTSNQSITLHPGWNMVGYPSLTNRDRTAALNNLTFGTEVDAIWTFNAATQTWVEIGGGDYFEVGRGYWVHATQECVWEVVV